jgi:hypothetical protein
LRDRGALDVSTLEIINTRGQRRPVEHFANRAESPPSSAVPENDPPIGTETGNRSEILPFPTRGGDDGGDVPPVDE